MANVTTIVRDAAGYARPALPSDVLVDGAGSSLGGGVAGPVDWSTIQSKPATYPPDVHTHAGLPSTVTLGADISPAFTRTTVSNATGLSFAVAPDTTYSFRFEVLFRSAATTTGLKVAVTCPASPATFSYKARIPAAADGVAGEFQGWGTTSGDVITATGVQAANTTYLATVEGVLRTGAAGGTLQLQVGTEVNASAITIKAYSGGTLLTR